MKKCPFCSLPGNPIEMIRPRADMVTFGTELMRLEDSDIKMPVMSNNVPIGDEAALLTITDNNNTEMRYHDYICPKCGIVLLYGEKIYNNKKENLK